LSAASTTAGAPSASRASSTARSASSCTRLEAQARPRNTAPGAPGATPALDELDAAEIIALLPSLDPAGLKALREHETTHRGRRAVHQGD
jgi:hypothetical protein